MPDDYVLKNGDVLKIDMGITYERCIADAAISLVIGGDHTNPVGADLIHATKLALDRGIETLQFGQTPEAYGQVVYDTIQESGYEVIRHLTGHGVGVQVHEEPSIYNRPHRNLAKVVLRPGMVIACEPITAERSTDYAMEPGNDWNLYTEYGDLGAQREYTVAITDHGPEILAGMSNI
ncbi:MAG: M24 family metallopeptidase [Candidatus Peribacteria bacterium]|nr:MAG: M24 family metallopeptidase [Candidatus Peribacteria bacterium]